MLTIALKRSVPERIEQDKEEEILSRRYGSKDKRYLMLLIP